MSTLLSSSLSRQTTTSKKEELKKDVTNIKIDYTRALEPARKKLTTLETQRIIAVLDNSIKQTEIITAIPSTLNNIEVTLLISQNLFVNLHQLISYFLLN